MEYEFRRTTHYNPFMDDIRYLDNERVYFYRHERGGKRMEKGKKEISSSEPRNLFIRNVRRDEKFVKLHTTYNQIGPGILRVLQRKTR
jgi:hypothetical protein